MSVAKKVGEGDFERNFRVLDFGLVFFGFHKHESSFQEAGIIIVKSVEAPGAIGLNNE